MGADEYNNQFAEVYENPEGWRFRIKGGNGEIIATGESYTTFESVVRGLHNVHPGIEVRKVNPLEGQTEIP